MKPKLVSDVTSRNVEKTVTPSEKRQKNNKVIKTGIIKWNTTKYLNC